MCLGFSVEGFRVDGLGFHVNCSQYFDSLQHQMQNELEHEMEAEVL